MVDAISPGPCYPRHGDTPSGAGFHRQRHGAAKLPGREACGDALLLAGCDSLIISDAGPQSSGVVAWLVSQKMPARLSHMGSEPRWRDPTDDLRDDVAVLFMVVAR